MVSEAMSSGKRVAVFMPDKKMEGLTKHEMALRALEADGYVTISTPETLGDNLEKALNDQGAVKKTSDSDNIFEAIRKII